MAKRIYDDQAFDQLSILADALEEAGCHEGAILEHFRGQTKHLRACRALELVLGRE
ncbi:MAG: hypothetical protein NZ700_00555 [Gemmataceae bacterium]|nr:hypothetical protein [Gemmataceae bacterium]MDW8264488.1 hypothetical protein [Gemmataceae bacterium]